MTKAEQETIFRWAADEEHVSVWTSQLRVKRQLERAGYQPYRASTLEGQEVGWFYKVPLAEFRWRAGRRTVRMVSEDERRARVERMRQVRAARRQQAA